MNVATVNRREFIAYHKGLGAHWSRKIVADGLSED